MNQIGESAGGCNPWPILEEDKTETDSEIKISYEFLKESSDISLKCPTIHLYGITR